MRERLLCLDIGDKRIGVAVSDPLGMTAQSLVTIERRHFKEDCAQLLKIMEEYGVQKIVIGLPLNSEGNEGPQAKKVRFFAEGLIKFLKEKGALITIEWWDESLTSQEAEEILLEADLSRKKRKKMIDKLAASLILQSYLDDHA